MTQDSEAARALGLVHGQVCYLQLPAASQERAAAFYGAVFGLADRSALPGLRGARPHRAVGGGPSAGPGRRPGALAPRSGNDRDP